MEKRSSHLWRREAKSRRISGHLPSNYGVVQSKGFRPAEPAKSHTVSSSPHPFVCSPGSSHVVPRAEPFGSIPSAQRSGPACVLQGIPGRPYRIVQKARTERGADLNFPERISWLTPRPRHRLHQLLDHMTAFGTFEPANLHAGRTRHDPHERRMRSAFRAIWSFDVGSIRKQCVPASMEVCRNLPPKMEGNNLIRR